MEDIRYRDNVNLYACFYLFSSNCDLCVWQKSKWKTDTITFFYPDVETVKNYIDLDYLEMLNKYVHLHSFAINEFTSTTFTFFATVIIVV